MIRSKFFPSILVCAGLVTPIASHATNGYFLIGYGSKSRAMGGVGIALAQEGTVAAVNPAGLSDVGTRFDASMTLFAPKRRAACCVGANGVVSGSNLFAIPTMGAAMKFDRQLSFGMAAVGAGANTRYNLNFFRDDPNLPGPQPLDATLGVSLIQLTMAPGIAYSFSKNHSLGVSMLIGAQQFRAYGLEVFKSLSRYPDNVTGLGNDFSYGAGARVGWRSHFFKKKFTVGATYASKIYMERFNKYKGLFAGDGGFDVPENYGIGFALRPNKKFAMGLDVVKILYSDIPSIGNPALPISANSTDVLNNPDKLGHPDGPGFGWSDQTIYKFGMSYQWNRSIALRAGYNYGKSTIPNSGPEIEFATLAPATSERHFTLGGSYAMGRNHEVHFVASHAKRAKQKSTVQGGTDLPFAGDVEIEMLINTVEVGYSFSF